MKKAISSVLICIALLLNLTAPVMASTNASTDVNRIELVYLTNDNSRASENGNGTPFVVKQYQGNQVVQEVTGYVGGPTIQIIDYYNGKIIKQTTRNVSDFVSKISETPSDSSNATSDYGSYLGRIIYNKASGSNEEREITVYSKQTYFNEESFRIHAEATDTISSLVGALVGAGLGVILGPMIDIPALVLGIVTGLGGGAVGGLVGIAIDEAVSVDAYYYTLTGYYEPTNYYSPGYEGIERLVQTKGPAYNKWFFEGYTPQQWKDGPLANVLYLGTFGGIYPYVKEYR